MFEIDIEQNNAPVIGRLIMIKLHQVLSKFFDEGVPNQIRLLLMFGIMY